MRLVIALLVLALCACENDQDPMTHGTVVNAEGTPVSNAQIHFSYQFEDELVKRKPTTVIMLELNEPSSVSIVLNRYGTGDFIKTLFEGDLQTGTNMVAVDFNDVTGGLYQYRVTGDGVSIQKLVIVDRRSEESLFGVDGVATTGTDGRFEISNSIFGIGVELPDNAGQLLQVPELIRFVAVKDSIVIGSHTVSIDPVGENEFVITQMENSTN